MKDGTQESVWTRGQPGGFVWIFAAVVVPVDGSTLVQFVGVVGNNTEGLLAVDDIFLRAESCDNVLPTAEPNSNACDFEDIDVCGYTSDGGWARVFPRLDNNTHHVPVDHTYNTGYGHYMEAALFPAEHEGVVGLLTSPDISQSEGVQQCASFWYVHNGATNKDRLTVYSDSTSGPLWQENWSNIDMWMSAWVPVPGVWESEHHLMWEAYQGVRNDYASMAIDDILITPQPCDDIGEWSTSFIFLLIMVKC
nr:MAM and LDL-receptor class A domain-containing protein 2-like [Cherax quadricarinatus]